MTDLKAIEFCEIPSMRSDSSRREVAAELASSYIWFNAVMSRMTGSQ
jgi:hypothetical protein